MSEEINFDDVEFGEPIEEREPNYRDGYIRGIYRARNIIDSKQKEIERLQRQKEELQVNGLRQETLFKLEIERLNNIIEKLEQENAVLKTQVVNKDKYSYGIRMGRDKE